MLQFLHFTLSNMGSSLEEMLPSSLEIGASAPISSLTIIKGNSSATKNVLSYKMITIFHGKLNFLLCLIRGFQLMDYIEGKVDLTTPMTTGSIDPQLIIDWNITLYFATNCVISYFLWHMGMLTSFVLVWHSN